MTCCFEVINFVVRQLQVFEMSCNHTGINFSPYSTQFARTIMFAVQRKRKMI